MDPKDKETKRYSSDDAASLALAGAIATLAGRVEEVVTIQAQLAKELAEHSAKSAAAQAMLLGEIERAKTEHLLRTGDQSKAIEILKIERESMDESLRQQIEYYRNREADIWKRLEKVSTRLEKGDLEIAKGKTAYEVLKWAGMVIGGLILAAVVAKLLAIDTHGSPLSLGMLRIGPEDVGPVSTLMSIFGSAWLLLSSFLAGAMQFVLAIRRHVGK